jgi:hypothetical protein
MQAQFARLAQEQGDVRVIAGVEDHVGPSPLQLGDERGQVGGRGGIAFVQSYLETGLRRAFGAALGDVGAVGPVLVDDGDAQILRVLAELRLGIGRDHRGRGQAPLRAVGLRPEDVLQIAPFQHRRGDAGGNPHEFLELLDPRRRRHALGRGDEAEQHVDLFLLDEAHRLVDRHVGLRLRVGVDRVDLVAVDAALRVEPVDHDLGAEIVQLGAAAGEGSGQIVDDADLDRLVGVVGPSCARRQRQTRDERRTGDAREPAKDHGNSPCWRRSPTPYRHLTERLPRITRNYAAAADQNGIDPFTTLRCMTRR